MPSLEDKGLFSESFMDEIRAEWLGVKPAAQDPDAPVMGEPDVCNLSLDLSEATYNLPFQVIEENEKLFDDILGDFAPWRVFRKLLKIKKREVDFTDLIDSGYWDGPEYVSSENGTFMGDPLSFIHLTVYLRSIVHSTFRGKKPLGQSVGDDLLLLAIKKAEARAFCSLIERTGGETSKFNSTSPNAVTFCEQYAYRPADYAEYEDYAIGSRFGDLFYLDTIKGSVLSGKSKVSASKQTPFFGHARMLNKQIQWHPIKYVSTRATKLLWSANYKEAARLGSATATLPDLLGGCNLAVGKRMDESDESYREWYKPYLERILTLPDVPFWTFTTLLLGIYKSNPKGVPYENSLETIKALLPSLNPVRVREINSLLPEWMKRSTISERLRYVSKVLNLGTIDYLVDELARRQAFTLLWRQDQDKARNFMTLNVQSVRKRHKEVWDEIRKSIDKMPEAKWQSSSPEDLSKRFQNRLWGYYYSKDSDSLKDVFGGMPTLYTTF